jgi:DNA modification methylase
MTLLEQQVGDDDFMRARPVIALPDGTIVAGEQRWRARGRIKRATCFALFADLNAAQQLEWSVRDNNHAGEFIPDALQHLLGDDRRPDRLALMGFTSDDVDHLLGTVTADHASDDTEPAAAPAEPRTKSGDLWALGEHRLLCGDAASRYDLDRVYGSVKVGCILADPPYGQNLDTDYAPIMGSMRGAPNMRGRGRTYRPVAGDDGPFDASHLAIYFADCQEQFWFGADFYRRTLSTEDRDGSWLVWDKRNAATDTVIGSGFELLWSKAGHKRDILRHYWCGAFGDPEARNRSHPTQKPTKLLGEILQRWAPSACIVADPFLGSGSTLLACENTGRVCYGLELDPGYCDVILDRWSRHTSRTPELLK